MGTHSYYLKGRDINEVNIKTNSIWIMRNILEQREYIGSHRTLWDDMKAKGIFNMQDVYMSLSHTPRVSWYKLILKNPARPISLLILWLSCHERLATKSRLCNFGIIDNKDCVFWREEEIVSHVLFDCVELNFIWSGILNWINMPHTPDKLAGWNQLVCQIL